MAGAGGMTVPRFLAFAGDPDHLQNFLANLVPRARSSQRLNRELDCPDLVVFASPETPMTRLNDHGLVIGHLYSRDSCVGLSGLDAPARAAAAATGGKSLLGSGWGNYVSFISARGATTVLRDPSAAVPVYLASIDDITVYFSDLALCDDLGLAGRTVDDEFLRQWLTFPGLRTDRTGLVGVKELVPGTAHRRSGNESRIEIAWTPWAAMESRPRLAGFEAASKAVRSAVVRTVAAQMSEGQALGLGLSGGLGSSIVAAALANGGIFLPAVNVAARPGRGEEREQARAVAQYLGFSLCEIDDDAGQIDLRPPARPALRPSHSPALQPLHRALYAFSSKAGTTGVVTGRGCRGLFSHRATAAIILDALGELGPAGAVAAARNVAAVTGCPVWKVAPQALRSCARQRRRTDWTRNERFISPEGLAATRDAHPWLDAPQQALPGKIGHVRAMVRALHDMEPEHPLGGTIVHPLFNQPLIETCLSIPSWLWIEQGREGAVARHAFADRLPAPTTGRRAKGRLEMMWQASFEEHRSRLAELLLAGEMARRRLVRCDQVEHVLTGCEPVPDQDRLRIFHLAALELWLRSRTS